MNYNLPNELQECLSVLERPAHIRQSLRLPQDPLAPPMFSMYCISTAPPSLLKQGGVSEISGRALRVTYWDSNLSCIKLPFLSSWAHFKFHKSEPEKLEGNGEYPAGDVRLPGWKPMERDGVKSWQIKQVWPLAWHDWCAGCLLYLHIEKIFQCNNVSRAGSKMISGLSSAGAPCSERQILPDTDFNPTAQTYCYSLKDYSCKI